MYFHYPTWLGSMPDPSLVPPPPVIFKAYYFKPENSTSAKHDNNQYKSSLFADDDIGVDYGPEYVRPMPYPPPPNPSKKEDYFDYWAYTRVYNTRSYSFGHAHEYPPFPRARPYGYSPSAYDYGYTHSHPHPHPHPQSQVPHSKPPPTSWSTQEATKAWRAKQKKVQEEWERRSEEGRQSRGRSGWEDWTPPTSTSRSSQSNGGWREGWCPPRSPSPTMSDRRWHDRARAPNGRNDGYAHGTGQSDKQWSWDYWRPDIPLRPSSTPLASETRLSDAFALYSKIWETLLSPNDSKLLMFRNIPWPQYPAPRSVEEIDLQNVQTFLMAGGRPLKVSLREALLRFHPDKTAMLLAHVAEKDKADVAAGCEAVTRCLSQLLKRATL